MYLNSFNYFRGIAIVFIVAGHCLYLSGWEIDTAAEKWIANIFLGGTFFFVFISGFLFHHIFHARFRYAEFIKNKIKNVLIPYLVLSVPLVLYFVILKGTGPYAEHIFRREAGIFFSYIYPVVHYLWTGRILEAYWYIPFIMIVFILSPLVMIFIRLRPACRLWITIFLLMVSLVTQRPVFNLSVLQSVVYFLPVYLTGILVSIHREILYKRLSGCEIHLLIVIGLLAMVQAWYYPSFGNLHKPFFQFGIPDILFIQKMVWCIFFIVLLHRFEKGRIPFLGSLASASFAVFFIHPYLLWGIQMCLNLNYPFINQIRGPGLWLVMTAAVILVSMAMAQGFRFVFKSRSRLIIGW